MFVFIQKQYPENFAFLILRILELFAREVCKFLKKLAVYKQTFHDLTCEYLKSKTSFNMKFSIYYFHMKTKILADFQICVSVPLRGIEMTENWLK